MACAVRPQFELYKGDSLDLNLAVTFEGGAPVDITNYTVRFSLRYAGGDQVWLKTSADSLQIMKTSAIAGECTVFLKPLDTSSLEAGIFYPFVADIVSDTGDVYTFLEGRMKLLFAI